MLKHFLEKEEKSLCEICEADVTLPRKPGIEEVGLNEYHKDGTIKIHHTCSKHIIDLYNKIVEEIENK
jgi:hypothetical protein